MNELIQVAPRKIGDDSTQTVNARELHAFLEVGKVFAAWIQDRITQYGFVEHNDFAVFSDSGKNPSGGRPSKEYAISLDMAKELAMVERNDKGKQARQYFIECERKAKSAAPLIPQSLPEALRLAADLADQKAKAEAALALAAPKAMALDRIATADGSFCLTDAGKALQMQPKRFTSMLQELQWIHRRPMGSGWLAYQTRIQQGVLEHKITTGERSDGKDWTNTQVRVTAKGMTKLAEMLAQGKAA